MVKKKKMSSINFVSFNQDQTCMSVGTSNGVRVFSCSPFNRLFAGDSGPTGITEMLFQTSLLVTTVRKNIIILIENRKNNIYNFHYIGHP